MVSDRENPDRVSADETIIEVAYSMQKGAVIMDFEAIRAAAKKYEPDMVRFLRDMIAIPSESCEEEGVIRRIEKEMKDVGFDEVYVDPEGNCLGFMGHGSRIYAFDGHIDTVGIGNIDNWKFDPYKGYENDTEIGGRGGSDQEGGIRRQNHEGPESYSGRRKNSRDGYRSGRRLRWSLLAVHS